MAIHLENDHVVYVLGAVFSYDKGLPMMGSFMNRLRDSHPILTQLGRDAEAQAVEQVLAYRRASAAAAYRIDVDLESIEQLFSLASIGASQMFGEIRLPIAATLSVSALSGAGQGINLQVGPGISFPANWTKVITQNAQVFGVNADRYEYYLACMTGLLSAPSPVRRTTILTFNYDTVVEDALFALNAPFNYGFKGRTVNFDATSRCESQPSSGSVDVLKLHGSLNWAHRKGRGRTFTVFGSYEDARSHGLVPEIIPPTWDKHLDGQLTEVWRRARAALSTATRIVIIGFSIPETDLHFKYLLAAGLSENLSAREILFVDPYIENIERRAALLLRGDASRPPQARFLKLPASNFFGAHGEFGNYLGRPFNTQKIHTFNYQ